MTDDPTLNSKTLAPLIVMLRRWKADNRLSAPEAAAELGVPLATLRNWLAGRRTPAAAAIARIESVCGVKSAAKQPTA